MFCFTCFFQLPPNAHLPLSSYHFLSSFLSIVLSCYRLWYVIFTLLVPSILFLSLSFMLRALNLSFFLTRFLVILILVFFVLLIYSFSFMYFAPLSRLFRLNEIATFSYLRLASFLFLFLFDHPYCLCFSFSDNVIFSPLFFSLIHIVLLYVVIPLAFFSYRCLFSTMLYLILPYNLFLLCSSYYLCLSCIAGFFVF